MQEENKKNTNNVNSKNVKKNSKTNWMITTPTLSMPLHKTPLTSFSFFILKTTYL